MLETITKWIYDNRDWLFDGLGVVLITSLLGLIGWWWRSRKRIHAEPPTTPSGSQITGVDLDNVEVGRDLTISEVHVGDKNTYVQSPEIEHAKTSARRDAYLSHVVSQVSKLSLAGMDKKAASSGSEATLNLNAVYTALLTQQQEHETEQGQPRARNVRNLFADPDAHEAQVLSAVAQLDRHARLVLLGAPGSGKSTFVNFVALCLAGEGLRDSQVNLRLLTTPLPKDENENSLPRNKNEETPPQPWQHGALLPVRVILRQFAADGLPGKGEKATATHLWNFICAELARTPAADFANDLQHELRTKGGLLLFDGLDEIPDAEGRRDQIKQAIIDFANTHRHCRILVTSRPYAYRQENWRLDQFIDTTLAPFSNAQIQLFVERWYAHIAPLRNYSENDARGRAQQLNEAIRSNDRLHVLAEQPLLLTLMASLHAWRGGSLPEKRELLYADAVDLLLDWWEQQRAVRNPDGTYRVIQPSLQAYMQVGREKLLEVLGKLAFAAHKNQQTQTGTADIDAKTLIDSLLAVNQNPDVGHQRLMEYLSDRAGLLLPESSKVYRFPHRTFQEYLAACYLTTEEANYPDLLADLTRSDPNRWREVALLAAAKAAGGAASTIWQFVETLCQHAPDQTQFTIADAWGAHLAGQALLESAKLETIHSSNQPKLDRVRNGLTALLRWQQPKEFSAQERALAGRTLARLGDTRPPVLQVDAMEFCHIPSAPFQMGDDKARHEINLTYEYWIARFPVTNAHFSTFVKEGGYATKKWWTEASKEGFWKDEKFKGRYDNEWRSAPMQLPAPFFFPNHPVVGISWYEALAFCRWLNQRWQKQGVLPDGLQVQLPNEPEWEMAARGGAQIPLQIPMPCPISELGSLGQPDLTQNKDPNRAYPWGTEADPERMNFERTPISTSNTVGAFPGGASPYGVEEMSGNVWEWMRSLYDEYPYPMQGKERSARELLSAKADATRVLRGGSFNVDQDNVRAAARNGNDPNSRSRFDGFRVVVSPSL